MDTPTGGVDRPLSNDDIVAKYQSLMKAVTSDARAQRLLETILSLDTQPLAGGLLALLTDAVENPLS